jgi:hypothetical protein
MGSTYTQTLGKSLQAIVSSNIFQTLGLPCLVFHQHLHGFPRIQVVWHRAMSRTHEELQEWIQKFHRHPEVRQLYKEWHGVSRCHMTYFHQCLPLQAFSTCKWRCFGTLSASGQCKICIWAGSDGVSQTRKRTPPSKSLSQHSLRSAHRIVFAVLTIQSVNLRFWFCACHRVFTHSLQRSLHLWWIVFVSLRAFVCFFHELIQKPVI